MHTGTFCIARFCIYKHLINGYKWAKNIYFHGPVPSFSVPLLRSSLGMKFKLQGRLVIDSKEGSTEDGDPNANLRMFGFYNWVAKVFLIVPSIPPRLHFARFCKSSAAQVSPERSLAVRSLGLAVASHVTKQFGPHPGD